MKNLIEIITEKILISKSTKKQLSELHELTPDEFSRELSKNNLGDKECKIIELYHTGESFEHGVCWKSQEEIGVCDIDEDYKPKTNKNWYIKLTLSGFNDEGEGTGNDLIDYNYRGGSYKRIIFYEGYRFIRKQFVPVDVYEDPKDKDIVIISIMTSKELKLINMKKSNEEFDNANPDFYELSNNKDLIRKMDSKYEGDKIPDNKKYKNSKNPKATLFWKVWSLLAINGPMSKEEVLNYINKVSGTNLVLTSYSTLFAQWKKENKISGKPGKLEAIPYSQWK